MYMVLVYLYIVYTVYIYVKTQQRLLLRVASLYLSNLTIEESCFNSITKFRQGIIDSIRLL